MNAFAFYVQAAVEASMFGLKPIFLHDHQIRPDAKGTYAHLIDNDRAEIIDDMRSLKDRLLDIKARPQSYLCSRD